MNERWQVVAAYCHVHVGLQHPMYKQGCRLRILFDDLLGIGEEAVEPAIGDIIRAYGTNQG
jgi:hypothetical protein